MSAAAGPLRFLHSRLQALREVMPGARGVPRDVVDDFNEVVLELSETVDERFLALRIQPTAVELLSGAITAAAGSRATFEYSFYMARVKQVLAMVEQLSEAHSPSNDQALGISDKELRSRAVSLLERGKHYDQVVNQATQVLEVRLRNLSRYDGKETGAALVSRVLGGNPALLLVSDDAAEQEGFANLCRGVMQFLRNSSHHAFKPTDAGDALRVCFLVDYLLSVLSAARSMEERL